MKEKTRAIAFDHIPVIDDHLLEVRAGLSAEFAVSKAACLDEGVQSLLHDAVQDGMSTETAFLCHFAMQVAEALRRSAGVSG